MTGLVPIEAPPTEVSPTGAPLQLRVATWPFNVEAFDAPVAPGDTLEELLRRAGLPERLWNQARVILADPEWRAPPEVIPRWSEVAGRRVNLWRTVRPKPGLRVEVALLPRGGGGGGKTPLRIVLTLAVIAASFAAPALLGPTLASTTIVGTLTVGSLVTTVVGAVGMLAVNALVPAPTPRGPQLAGPVGRTGTDPLVPTITGISNARARYGAKPWIVGRMKVFPPLAAEYYTTTERGRRVFYGLFEVGYGPLRIEDLRLGNTPLADLDDVQVEICAGYPDEPPPSLYPFDVAQAGLQVEVTAAGGWVTRTMPQAGTRLSIDIQLPQLAFFNDDGSRSALTVEFDLEYRQLGGPWRPLAQSQAVAAQSSAPLTNVAEVRRRRAPGESGGEIEYSLEVSRRTKVWRGAIDVRTGALKIAEGDGSQTFPDGLQIFSLTRTTSWTLAGSSAVTVSDSAVLTDVRPPPQKAAGHFAPVWDGTRVTVAAGAVSPPPIVVSGNSTNGVWETVGWQPAEGRGLYEIRLRRLTPDATNDRQRDVSFLAALRVVDETRPAVRDRGFALIALRVEGTEQLQGLLDQLSCVATSIRPVWDGTDWEWRPTRTAAWSFIEALRGRGSQQRARVEEIDLEGLRAWALDDEAEGRCVDLTIESFGTLEQCLRRIANAARADLDRVDGRYTVLRDLPQPVRRQLFGPDNSWGFRYVKRFPEQPDAVRALFLNPEAGWQQDEIVVYAEGRDETTARVIVEQPFDGVTDARFVYKDVRRQLAELVLRSETFTFQTDWENRLVNRGDRVGIAHPVILVGLGSGRVRRLLTTPVTGGDQVDGLVLDVEVEVEIGVTYGLKVRKADATELVIELSAVPGVTRTLLFTAPIPPGQPAPEEGDLAFFGEAGLETVDAVVKNRWMAEDLTATIECVPAAPELHVLDGAAIPPIRSGITLPPDFVGLRPPPKPAIQAIVSDETVLLRGSDGSLSPRILVTLVATGGRGGQATSWQARARLLGASDWDSDLRAAAEAPALYIDGVRQSAVYELQIRGLNRNGQPSDWTASVEHRVVGKSSLPPDVPSLWRETSHVIWPYEAPLDLAGFLVRVISGRRGTWELGEPAHAGILTERRIPIDQLGSGPRTVLVRAVDVAGNLSAGAAMLQLDLGDPLVANVVLERPIDLAAEGTLTDGARLDGELRAADDGAAYLVNDDAPYLPEPQADYLPIAWREMAFAFGFSPPRDAVPSALSLDSDIEAGAWRVEYVTGGDGAYLPDGLAPYLPDGAAPYLEPPGPLAPWPGSLPAVARRYDLRVTTAADAQRGVIRRLRLLFDVPDQREALNDVAVAPAPTRLPTAKSWRRITHVNLTLQDDGGGAASLRLLDRAIEGPLVDARDAAGQPVAATIDAEILGVPAT
ncbi:TipJ family phage tail tip protein [Algihabitans albus]|uniref:TipJ family phage tail tip protein n=1 Tax=Algihabitans albus TaxID=2164067 RepID=UPI000E5CF280|nr:hypothetical protein [Algihabitans albus]